MNFFKTALLLMALSFALQPTVSFAQVPDNVQSTTPTPQIGRSQSALGKARDEERAMDIESVRSDMADLSKFDHGNEYLPKIVYKRHYAEKRTYAQAIAGRGKSDNTREHHM